MANSRHRPKTKSFTAPHHHHIAVGFTAITAGAICFALAAALVLYPGERAEDLFTAAVISYPRSSATALSWKLVTPQDGLIAFDVRYSTEPMTASNFSTAVKVNNPPRPQTTGQVQSMTITGLQPDTVYYLALKAKDAAGNWSALSNVSTKVTSSLARACRPTYLCSDWLPCRDHHRVRTCSNSNGCNSDLGQPITDQYCDRATNDKAVAINQHLVAIGQGPKALPIVRIYDPADWTIRKQLTVWPSKATAGMHLASGDINGDHRVEFIATSTRLMSPQLRIYSAAGALLASIDPYPAVAASGVSVAVGDVDGNGMDEIIIGTDHGAGAMRVLKYDPATGQVKQLTQVLPYGPSYTDGFKLATGDIDNDGRAEIIVTRRNTTDVEIYKYHDQSITRSWQFQVDHSRSDVEVTTGDINGDGEQEIITANGSGTWTTVRVFNQAGRLLTKLLPYNRSNFGGVSMTALDINHDGQDEILTVPASRAAAQLRAWQLDPVAGGWKLIKQFMTLPAWPDVGASITAS